MFSGYNPLGYKLSWSPRGVLLAGRNDAIFLRQGERVMVPGKDLYEEKVYRVDDFQGAQGVNELEWYPRSNGALLASVLQVPVAGFQSSVVLTLSAGPCSTRRFSPFSRA